jgi:hypothetical protein
MSDYTAERWKAEHSSPLRLQITCRLDGYDMWHVPYEIDWRPSQPSQP